MLTSDDIKNISFRRSAFGGYKPEDVDAFVDDIQLSYEEIMRENQNLTLTVQKLERNLKKFYSEEDSIRKVLLDLKMVTEKSLEEAKTKATNIISEATNTSESIISEAKKKVACEEQIAENLKKESTRLKNCLEKIYEEHLKIINKIPNFEIKEKSNESCSSLNENESKSENQSFDKKNHFSEISNSLNIGDNQNLKFGQSYRVDKSSFINSAGIYGGVLRKDS